MHQKHPAAESEHQKINDRASGLIVTDVIPHVLFAGRTNLIFVEVQTNAGMSGMGEASLEGKTEAVVGAINDVKEYLIGMDPTLIEHHWQTIYRHSFWRGGVVIGSAISGIEQALWDILGKSLDVPVFELLGGRVRDQVRLYANGPRGESPEEIAESCRRLVEQGWSALKLAPFEAVTGVARQEDLHAAHRQLSLIRDMVGPDVDILIDCHGRLTPTSAVQMANALDEFGIFFFEEPVLPEDVASMAMVADAISIPIATGERLFTKWGFRDVLELGAASVLQPDLAHCGGIWEARKIAAAAEVSYVGIAPHNPYSWLLTMASIQLDFAIPNFLIQEFLVDHPPEVEQLFAEKFTWSPGGWVEPPTKPGLGIEFDWDAIRAHEQLPYTRTYQPSLWHVDGSVADW
jgi:galactonate dehydratase